MLNFIEYIWFKFLLFIPSSDFLSDIATIEAVMMGIAIPLSFDIISRISERFQSEVITKNFIKELEVKLLPLFLVINIILAITLRFFTKDIICSFFVKILFFILLLFFIIIFCIFIGFFNKVRKYAIDTEYILNKLYGHAKKIIK